MLLNVALHGLENAAGVHYHTGTRAGETVAGSPVLIRYADDLAVFCHSQEQARQVKAQLAGWLAPRGLAFNEDKTTVVHLSQGFDFLGVNARRYQNGTLLTKPSAEAVTRLKRRLASDMRALRGSNTSAVLAKLVPITRGWAAYYRSVVSSKVLSCLVYYVWKLTHKWAKHNHGNKPTSWIVHQYFGKLNTFRNDRWMLGDRASGTYLPKFSWTPIVRHTMVKGRASPDDPTLTEYWATRRRKAKPPLDRYTLRLLTRQHALCPLCGEHLLSAEQPPQSPTQWERWCEPVPVARTPDLRWPRPPGRMPPCLHLTHRSSVVERSSSLVWASNRSPHWPKGSRSASRACGIGCLRPRPRPLPTVLG